MILEFEFLEKPIGKERPRMFFNRGKTIFYTPKNTKNFEKNLGNLVKQIMIDRKLEKIPRDIPVAIEIGAYFKIPENLSKNSQKKLEENTVLPIITPDIDNISKIILDALNGIVYEDDAQVIYLNAIKFYGKTSKILIKIFDYEEFKDNFKRS